MLIRGFRVQGNMDDFRKNGFRDSSRVQRDMSNIERNEIFKGPASVLYGAAGEPGGLVNLITKRPLEYRYSAVDAQLGGFDEYRFSVDSTGPLGDGGGLFYRLNRSAEDNQSFRDFVYKDRYFIAPVLRWDVGQDTRTTFDGDHWQLDEAMCEPKPLQEHLPLWVGGAGERNLTDNQD